MTAPRATRPRTHSRAIIPDEGAGPDEILAGLPGYLNGITPRAEIDRGERVLTWTIERDGTARSLWSNQYREAWITLRETGPVPGPGRLYVEAMRVPPSGIWSREPFRAAALEHISDEILPVFGEPRAFDAVWVHIHRRATRPGDVAARIAAAEACLAWWRYKAELDWSWAHGTLLHLAPLEAEDRPYYQRPQVRVADDFRPGHYPHANVVARVGFHTPADSFEHAGWLTDSGEIIPLASWLNIPGGTNDA